MTMRRIQFWRRADALDENPSSYVTGVADDLAFSIEQLFDREVRTRYRSADDGASVTIETDSGVIQGVIRHSADAVAATVSMETGPDENQDTALLTEYRTVYDIIDRPPRRFGPFPLTEEEVGRLFDVALEPVSVTDPQAYERRLRPGAAAAYRERIRDDATVTAAITDHDRGDYITQYDVEMTGEWDDAPDVPFTYRFRVSVPASYQVFTADDLSRAPDYPV